MVPEKITAKHYYELVPDLEHCAGDIWSDLPTYGLLGESTLSGIIVSPPCDLANRKVDHVTYLPIVPVRAYFVTPAAIPLLLREAAGQLEAAGIRDVLGMGSPFMPPDVARLERISLHVQATLAKPDLRGQTRSALERASAGLRLLSGLARREMAEADACDLEMLFGKSQCVKLLSQIVSNAFRADLHFLPADSQPLSWAAVPKHSLVLFRYPLNVPVEILDAAQDLQKPDWKAALQQLAAFIPAAPAFSNRRPMKRATLRSPFIADLLTRYVSMHVRLGSPDFTRESVEYYAHEIMK